MSIGRKLQSTENSVTDATLGRLGLVFLKIGGTTFGGMWGAIQVLEDELVRRRAWLTLEEQKALMVAATLIPAPKFLAFGAMVGFRLSGWSGSVVSLVGLLVPPAFLVVVAIVFLSPEIVGDAIIPVQRAVGVAVVGLLFGNAYLQIRSTALRGRQLLLGVLLTSSVFLSTLWGVPLAVAAITGFVVGALVIKRT